jgi:predicted polyphosphate/ATP-dependent NAD kinase
MQLSLFLGEFVCSLASPAGNPRAFFGRDDTEKRRIFLRTVSKEAEVAYNTIVKIESEENSNPTVGYA